MRSLIVAALLFTPCAAFAQTLTFEIDAGPVEQPSDASSAGADVPPPVLTLPRPDGPRASDHPVLPDAPRPVVIAARPDAPPAVSPPPGAPASDPVDPSSDDPIVYLSAGWWLDRIALDSLPFRYSSPEVRALAGVDLQGWSGLEATSATTITGASVALGLQLERFIRGPELRVSFGGGTVPGAWATAPSRPSIELATRSALACRAELLLGLQLPIGIVTPYVQARGSAGAVWLEVATRDANLGELGSESIEHGLFEFGIEGGLTIRFADEVFVGGALRGNLLGPESIAGTVSFGVQSS